MSNASQPKATLASDGPQTAAEAKSQTESKECKLTREEFAALFKAAGERTSKMSVEEVMKQNSWSQSHGVGPIEAMQALEDIEAEYAGSDDDGDATEKGQCKTSTKHKD